MTGDGLDRYRGATVMAVGAHPDDLEAGAGGTLARLARAGARVVAAVMSVPNQPAVRAREARLAAELLGCELRLVTEDGRHVEDMKTYAAVSALDSLVKELRPALMICHAACDHHVDHLLTGRAALATMRLGPFDVWRYATALHAPLCQPFAPTLFVDISGVVDLKLRALEAHASQYSERGRDTLLFRDDARHHGARIGVPYAEAFEVGRFVMA
jgi:LmbE family N-acetylglucosaminyl deacetylase